MKKCESRRWVAGGIAALAALCSPAQAATQWLRIASEGASFTVSGTQTVRYGSGTSWVQRSVTTSGQCTNTFFGSDPLRGVGKQCERLVTLQPLPAPAASPPPVVNYEYDAQGNPTRSIQAPGVAGFGFATQNTYDPLDRLQATTDARAGRTQFAYNGREDLTQVTDPRNLVTRTPRDGLGQATQLASPDTGTASHTYDAAGNLRTRTDSRGVLTTYSYDVLNRLTRAVHTQSGQASRTESWTYDQTGTGFAYGIGRLTSAGHPDGSSQYVYNAQGQLVTEIQRVNAATGANAAQVTRTTSYTYDAAGNVTSIAYPSGRRLVLGYTQGRLSSMSLAANATATPSAILSELQWQPFGGPKSWQWHTTTGTQVHERQYDTAGRPVRYRLGGVIRDLAYDAADRISGYTHLDAATGTATAAATALNQGFSYDALGRLTGTSLNAGYWSFEYDANGNRTRATVSGSTSNYTIAATSNRIAGITNPARSFAYDNAGNTTADGSFTAGYDLPGRMRTLAKAGVTTTYAYDGMGKRVRKFSSTGAASTVIFVYDQNQQLLGEYSSTGAPIREYVWLGGTPIAVFQPDPANANNPPLVYYIHADHLDTPRVVTDRAGNVRWRWMAEPFGTTAAETSPTGLAALVQNLRFPGQYFDQESGLHYNYFRNYDSTIGRYITPDPLGHDGGDLSLYQYASAQPTRYTDPLGLSSNDPANGRPAAPAIGIPNPSAQAQQDLARRLSQLFCEPDCIELQAQMEQLAGELRSRYVEMTADVSNLYCSRPIGQFSWMGHQIKFQNKQRQLHKLVERARAKGCNINPEHERLTLMPAPFCPSR